MLKVKLKEELKALNNSDLENQEYFVKEVKMLIESNAKEEIDILKQMGLGSNILKAEQQTKKYLSAKEISDKYEGEVYTIDQIKHLAIKYNLRFLNTKHFTGSVPSELGSILLRFKEKHLLSEYDIRDKFFILAPAKVFKLTKRPIDPLLFYKVYDRNTDEIMYKLVHKWGDDFNITRRISGLINGSQAGRAITNMLLAGVVCLLMNYLTFQIPGTYVSNSGALGALGTILNVLLNIVFVVIMGAIISCWSEGELTTNEERWNSEYID